MKILRLEVEGFRSLKEVCWSPGPMNVVIGQNGAGKSNLLRLLELMSVVAGGGLSKYIKSLGGMDPLVWDGEASHIAVRATTSPVGGDSAVSIEALTYRIELARLGTGGAFRIDDESLMGCCRGDTGTDADAQMRAQQSPLQFLQRNSHTASIFDPRGQALTAPQESVPDEESLLSLAAGPFVANRLVTSFQQQMASWCVYHDVHATRDSALRRPAVARTETRVDSDGQNLIPVLHTLYTGDREFKRQIDSGMRAAFGEDFEELVFPPASDQRVQLRIRWRSLRREQSAAELSDGTLRFLFLMTILGSPSAAPVIAIDEPETGLHPRMLPIIAEYAADASLRSQVILTTHSPEFLNAFRSTPPQTTVVKWQDGVTSLVTLQGERLAYWLKQYKMGELFRSGELEEIE